MTISELYEEKRKNIEDILENVYEGNTDIFNGMGMDFTNEDYNCEEIDRDDDNVDDLFKWFFLNAIDFFQLQMCFNDYTYKLDHNEKETEIPVNITNESAYVDIPSSLKNVLEKELNDSGMEAEELQTYIQNQKEGLEEASKDIKEIVQKLIKLKAYNPMEIRNYLSFLQDDKRYVSISLFVELNKSLQTFAENGKCKEKTFTLVLAFYFDFLNSILDEKIRFSQKVVDYVYSVAFMSVRELPLQLLSDLIMNDVYINNQRHKEWMFDKEKTIKELKDEYSQNFCLTYFEKDDYLRIFNIIINLNHELYEPFLDLYLYSFEEAFVLKKRDYEFLNQLWAIKDSCLTEMPGLLYCICKLFENIDKKDIFEFFERTNLKELKEEYVKLERLPDFRNTGFTGGDKKLLDQLFNPLTQKQKSEAFLKKLPLMEAVFFYRLYAWYAPIFRNQITISVTKTTEKDENEFRTLAMARINSLDDLHHFFLRKKYTEKAEQKRVLETICQLACGKNIFENCPIDFEKNSEETCRIIYFLYNSKKDNLHSIVDFLNHVREKQLKVLPVLPDKYMTYTKEEADTELQRLKNNQKLLSEKIDIGFNYDLPQPVSNLSLSKAPVFYRFVTIKSFTETDKKYELYSKPYKNLYKLDKKEDFRVTNKNLLKNHYLYSDRNVFTHDAANYMVIENLIDDEKTENLLFALMDIKKFLNQMRHMHCSNKKNFTVEDAYTQQLLGIDYLLMDWNDISKKLLKKIIYADDAHQKDPWKAVIDNENDIIRHKYVERIKNLDYIHDLGRGFLDDLSKFLTKVYTASPVFLENAGFSEYLYLIFQDFALEEFIEQ